MELSLQATTYKIRINDDMADILDLALFKQKAQERKEETEEYTESTLEDLLETHEFLDLAVLVVDAKEAIYKAIFVLVFNYKNQMFEVWFKGSGKDANLFYNLCSAEVNNYREEARRYALLLLVQQSYRESEVYEYDPEQDQ